MHATILHAANWSRLREQGRKRRERAASNTSRERPAEEPAATRSVYHTQGREDSAGDAVSAQESKVALPLVPVRVYSPESKRSQLTYALLDTGSNVTLCHEQLLRALGIQGRPETMSLTTLDKKQNRTPARVVSLDVESSDGEGRVHLGQVYARDSLPIDPRNRVMMSEAARWSHLKGLPLHHAHIDEVMLLIGQDYPDALVPLATVPGGKGEPYAVRTRLGWTVNGPMDTGKMRGEQQVFFAQGERYEQLNQQVERFWKLESSGIYDDSKAMSVQDEMVTARWERTATYDDEHYTLPVPLRHEDPQLPDSKQMAELRLRSLRKKLERNPELSEEYTEEMEDLLSKGYTIEVPQNEVGRQDGKVWYLPHHPVVSPNKEKPRIVFDCAVQHRGVSLNSRVLQGPDLTNKLVGVLTRFRLHQVALMADVEAMFHQVRVKTDDQDALRFPWWPRGNTNEPPRAYRMTVHLFGGAWSPSCCTYAMHRTVQDHEHQFSELACETVRRNFYVDDRLESVDSIEEAVALASELKELLARGGFNLTKWTSNYAAVLEEIPPSDRSKKIKERDIDAPLEERALGVYWSMEEDYLGFRTQVMSKPLTKRGMLSMLSSIYDPLGIASPFILGARRIVQDLCRGKLGWDEKVGPSYEQQWTKWMNGLEEIATIKVPRCVLPSTPARQQLHHFADASEKAYGVVSYLRSEDQEGRIHSNIVMAKSRLAPLKTLTIPRLELQAATLATRQDALLRRELDLDLEASQFWTDSTIVLQYISNQERRFHTFVANRVAEIRERTEVEQWHHVSTKDNPADDASRGVAAVNLGLPRWLHGPAFLLEPQEDWPKSEVASTLSHEDPEVKDQEAVAFAIQTQPGSELVEKLIASYSHWIRLVRTVACFKSLARQDKSSESESRVGAPQLQQAEDSLIIHVQEQYYPEELIALRAGRGISPSSPLYKLGPSLVKGIIVATGRLKNASLPSKAREPPIIPHEHPIAEKIVRFTHEKTAHSGREYVVAEIRRKYWITGVRGLVKRVVRKCITCRRQDARPCEQQMGDLPPDRVTSGGPAFMSVGVDYFGPIAVKRGRGREKRYGCLFTCLSSRAVHIEVVEYLDTDSFINCLQRFIARRGLPELIRSDNGRNFVGAERELREGLQAWKQEKIEGDLSEKGVRWIFNTPTASHMGGVWERQIRSVRRILSRLIQEQVMSSEVLTTLLVTAEGILNNRPLTAASSDPSDLEPLTPNHLLIHRPARAPPGLYANGDSRQEKRWRQVLHLADVFWQRWTREYLPLLRQRTKWQQPHRNVSRGDLVLVTDKQLPRNEWSTGRVINVIEGQDGLVRTAEVRTHAGTFLRPVVKLCVLEENAFGQQQNVDEIAPLKKRRRRAD